MRLPSSLAATLPTSELPAPIPRTGRTGRTGVAAAVERLDRSTTWELVERVPLGFDAFHPQGMAIVGDRVFLSSVEVVEPTVPCAVGADGRDRTAGAGVGHLFVLDRAGTLLHDLVLGEGDAYHPGGVDAVDGTLWIAVAEYRPCSRSIVYRVDTATLAVEEAFRVDDHVGGVAVDRASGHVHGISWGSRTFYGWTTDGLELWSRPNASHMVDHQDCQSLPGGLLACGGVAAIAGADGREVELGALTLLDPWDGRVLHEVPVQARSAAGHVVTRNPVHLEAAPDGLRLWAAPDDGDEIAGTELLVLRPR